MSLQNLNSDVVQNGFITVGIGEATLSNDRDKTIITYALGSCLGVALYDPIKKMGGILHCLLPLSSSANPAAPKSIYTYVDTGVTQFLTDFFRMGGSKENIIIKTAGCGNMQSGTDSFKIGERNFAVFRKIIWKNNLLIKGEKMGGSDPKTMSLEIATGRCFVKSEGNLIEL